jgi:ring-1,2-phenylacetyl-CoA epoxidase subunit PaaC
LWAFTGELFETDDAERRLIESGVAIDPESVRGTWQSTIETVLREATLTVPSNPWMQQGGRSGRHTEHLGRLLAELQHMQRTYPGLTW